MAMLINFNALLQAYLPLTAPTSLGNPDLDVPVSVLIGDDDWVLKCDDGASIKLVEQSK
jgi:hypothetical protein